MRVTHSVNGFRMFGMVGAMLSARTPLVMAAAEDHFCLTRGGKANCDFAASKQVLDTLKQLTAEMIDFRLYPDPPGPDPVGDKHPENEARALWWRTSNNYLKRFWSACAEQGVERVAVRCELVAGCPDEWDFRTDPKNVGESLEWHRDVRIGGDWKPLKTLTARWSDQALHDYKGFAWYRIEVVIPKQFDGRKVYLWFGGVDENATVWLNGGCVGTTAEPGGGLPGVAGAFKPVEFEVSQALRFGQGNTIAVKVENKVLDEIGTSGIVAPVMFWSPRTGPADKQKEKTDDGMKVSWRRSVTGSCTAETGKIGAFEASAYLAKNMQIPIYAKPVKLK
ncbi:MAG: hypothetical protein HY360_15105 [Verrucomicrobia bacterium]|nr:hypothetical protein [Verrucomicrobiota bacterium]